MRAALAARDEFFSVASHELKTPVTALQLHLDGILMMLDGKGLAPEEQRRRLARAQASCVRLGKLIDELLDVSRAAAGTLRLEREEMDLAVTACEVVGRFAEQARRAGCRLVVDAPHPVIGSWDRTRIEQVLDNLLANAITYAPGQPVTVAASTEGGRAVISVKDSGPGIAPEEQRRVFDRFVRLGQERTANGGFGLGLWIVREIAEAHGGAVDLSSAPGEGCLFRVELPLP
jgi:signal transduction histidine kinase